MKTYIVDSFTDTPFRGNPAGVCVAESNLSDEKMLNIAKELNLSETAFIRPLGSKSSFSIRYFSPKMEIPLCGHATLASAKVVFEAYGLARVDFTTVGNILLEVESVEKEISMKFPIYETEVADAPAALLEALGIDDIVASVYNDETRILMLEISSCEVLAALDPDFDKLKNSHSSINGVLVTSLGDTDYDFYSRYFWPWSGSNEDPVTGGTHTFMAPYWSRKLGKTTLKSFQCSERSGYMTLNLDPPDLYIKSNAVVIFEGDLKV